MLTLVQITDLHITSPRHPESQVRNEARLRQVLQAIGRQRPPPTAIIVSGDLTDFGEPEEYAALASILAEVDIPFYLAMGNHDRRAPLLATFGSSVVRADDNGFVQYVVDLEDLRLVICDTVEEGQSGGAFCEQRRQWLTEVLDSGPTIPTVLVIHHPPIESGIQWMDPEANAPWIGALESLLDGRGQIQGIVCGHIHRPFHGGFAGHRVSVSGATSLQLTLDLTDIDKAAPDGRELLVGEPPAYSLLSWGRGRLTIHHCVAGNFQPNIPFTAPLSGR